MTFNTFLTAVLNVAVYTAWFIITYQLILAVAGFVTSRRARKERETILDGITEWPPITIMVPAHNEEKVIERTILSLLSLDYPVDKLEILVINDASTDTTAEIIDRLARQDKRVRPFHRFLDNGGGRGKAAALNAALKTVTNEFVAIYDADNRPEHDALKLLMANFIRNPELGAVLGKFRTGNRRKNLLTRFINIEGLGFQGIMQAGRWQFMGVSALSGTNYIIRRSVVNAVGGWDVEALAEDAELSVRMYQDGYRIKYIPYSDSWEQEPETLAVWLKQRTRWARGNNYAWWKLIKTFGRSKHKWYAAEFLFTLSIPYMLLYAILAMQFFWVMSMFKQLPANFFETMPKFPIYNLLYLLPMDIFHTMQPVYHVQLGMVAIVIYYLEILLVLSYDEELTFGNMILIIVMYFTYCQVWPLASLRALWSDLIMHDKRIWDKTVRFDGEIDQPDAQQTSLHMNANKNDTEREPALVGAVTPDNENP